MCVCVGGPLGYPSLSGEAGGKRDKRGLGWNGGEVANEASNYVLHLWGGGVKL